MTTITQMLAKAKGVILRQGVSPQDADDILQEAFARLEAYTQTQELRSREAFLVTAAVNISRDQARHRKTTLFDVSGRLDLEAIADSAPQPEEQARAHERLRRASTGLAKLDEKARRCLIMQRLDGLTYAQIAEAEGVSVAAVEKRVARGVMFLTRWMDGW